MSRITSFKTRRDENFNSISVNDITINGGGTLVTSSTVSEMYARISDACFTTDICSGFFIESGDSDYAITCAHCVMVGNDLKNRIIPQVSLVNNYNNTGESRVIEFDIIGIDGAADIAVLKPKNPIPNQTKLKWGDSRIFRTGDDVFIIGNPQGLDHRSITRGVVRDNTFGAQNGILSVECVTTDCDITGGNSGSPIVDINGNVVGIAEFEYGTDPFSTIDSINGGTSQYIMQRIVEKIIAGNGSSSEFTDSDGDYTKKGWLGISWHCVQINDIEARSLVDSDYDIRGIVVDSIESGGGIDNQGSIQQYDWITEIDGVRVGEIVGNEVPGNLTWFKTAGQTVTVKYIPWGSAPSSPPPPISGGTVPAEQTVTITLAAFPTANDYPPDGNPGNANI